MKTIVIQATIRTNKTIKTNQNLHFQTKYRDLKANHQLVSHYFNKIYKTLQ